MLKPIKMSPAIEAAMYANIMQNRVVKNQDHLRIPRDKKTAIVMMSPSPEATYGIIDRGYATFYKDGIRAYTTDIKIKSKIGNHQVLINGASEFRKAYMSAVENRAIRFYDVHAFNKEEGTSFIYDTGEWHRQYFNYRLIKDIKYTCENYLTFFMSLLDQMGAEDYNKILYFPIDEWAKTGSRFGIGANMMDNPLSILLKAMRSYPAYAGELMKRARTLLIVNEDKHEIIKYVFPEADKINDKVVKDIYQKLKVQLKKLTIEYLEITEEGGERDEIAETSINPASPTETKVVKLSTATKCAIAEELKRNLTGNAPKEPAPEEEEEGSVLDQEINDDTADVVENEEEEEPEESVIDEVEGESDDDDSTNDEITDVIDNAVATIPELSDDSVSDAEKKKILEDEVKKEVYIAKFSPERTKKQMEYIEVARGRQQKILEQSFDEMKSKIIDESSIDNVIETANESLKHVKFANADKSYVEKKYIPDINNAVAKLADGDVKVFIESIDEVDSSDQMNQKKTLTYHLVDEYQKKHTISFDVPIIRDGCHMFLGGADKIIMHQRIFKPIVKIRPDRVQIVTFYNKIEINRQGSSTSSKILALKKFFTKHADKYKVKFGNARAMNGKYKTSIEFDDMSRSFTRIEIPAVDTPNVSKYVLYFDLQAAEEAVKKNDRSKLKNFTTESIPFIECVHKDGSPSKFSGVEPTANLGDVIFSYLNKVGDGKEVESYVVETGRFAYARAKILNAFIPIAVFCLFCEGFTSCMKKCGIDYKFVRDKGALKAGVEDGSIWTNHGTIKTSDGIIVYPSYPLENSLFMNGLRGTGLDMYTFQELDSKDTYIDIISQYYASANQANALDNFRMFMIDKKTEEILKDFDLPTDLIEVLFYACRLLATNQYLYDNDMHNMRIRSNEIIAQIAYQYVVQAYAKFYKTAGSKRAPKLSVPKDAVIKALLSSSLVDEGSVVNPIYQMEKTRACTISASTSATGITLTGINKTENYTMDKRAYDPSMVGIFGVTSPFDGNTGIVRDLALEPAITSTNGYVEVTDPKDIDNLSNANLFTAIELLTPLSVLSDDPQRAAMMRGQTSKMVMTDKAQPVLMGNKVESVIPYHLNGDFCFVAKQNGKVIDEKDGVYVVQYADGSYDSFDTNEKVRKNSADGVYTRIKFETRTAVGKTFKKNEVLAVEPTAMTFDKFDKGASCNIGVLAKVAIVSLYDTFEDSEPITTALSKKLGYYAIEKKTITLDAPTYVERMVKIGDHVNINDPLIVFDSSRGDPEVQKYMERLRQSMSDSGIAETLVEANNTTAKAPTTGEISNIIIYSTVPIDELSPSLQKIVNAYHRRINGKEKFLDQYKNKGDNKYFKCGQLLSETTDVVEAKFGKVKGEYVGEGVVIEFYIKHHDIMKKGDKATNYCAAKGVNSHIIPEGLEPWSEDRPEEEVSAFITPISISARKIPSMYPVMFGNKVLIEAKRRMVEKYKKTRGLK